MLRINSSHAEDSGINSTYILVDICYLYFVYKQLMFSTFLVYYVCRKYQRYFLVVTY